MTVRVDESVVHLTGRCLPEDAEPLLEILASGLTQVDLAACEHLHSAVFQLLMAGRVQIRGELSPFLGEWLQRILIDPETS